LSGVMGVLISFYNDADDNLVGSLNPFLLGGDL
jgi:hypothetical protein